MFRFTEYKEKWRRECDVDLKPLDIERREDGFVAVARRAKDALVAAQTDASKRKRRRKEELRKG